jgi:parallel beta-helix repeat protein
MNNQLALVLFLIAITASCLVVIQPVKADVISWYNCVVILPDGTLSDTTGPVQAVGDSYTLAGNTLTGNTTAPIQRVGDTYTLIGNINDYTLLPQRNNIVIDGAGFTIQGSDIGYYGVGICLWGVNNVTVKNVEITRCSIGIQLRNSSNCVITNNVLGNPHNWYADRNGNGISLGKNSVENLITNNIIQGGGISVSSSSNNTFVANMLYDGGFNMGGIYGSSDLQEYMNIIDTSNQVDGAPVYFLVNQSNLVIDSATHPKIGYLALINCNNVTVKGVSLMPNRPFALLVDTTNSTLTGIKITVDPEYSSSGIVIRNSKNNIISNNNLSSTPSTAQNFGLSLWDSANNTISGNIVSGFWWSIPITRSNNTVVSGNTLTLSWIGIPINGFDNQAFGNHVSNTVLATDRTVYPNSGTGLSVSGSNNQVFRNTVENNGIGLVVDAGSNNSICQNNFINNTKQVNVDPSANVTWDNGREGNYWSDYTTKYPLAAEIDSTGIGNTPYVIDSNNIDHYPIVEPVTIPEFPSAIVLAALFTATLAMAVFFKRKNSGNS